VEQNYSATFRENIFATEVILFVSVASRGRILDRENGLDKRIWPHFEAYQLSTINYQLSTINYQQ